MKRKELKNVVELIKDMRYNAKNGFNVGDYNFTIRYKDGTVIIVYAEEILDTKFSLNLKNIKYAVYEDGDDAIDSEGKSWLRDFLGYKNGTSLEELNELIFDNGCMAVEKWNEYVNYMLYA